ncbi:MAG: amidase, partial [Pseudomonadota bacterium]|nr:amidase [Pseudomonadota bacterium]
MTTTHFTNPIMAAGIAGLRALYADRAVTPVEATDAYLSRIRGLDGALGAFVHVDAEGAHAAAHASAERWRTGKALSPIDGAPIAVKANIAVRGFPWHAGIEAYRTRIAEEDAECIRALRAAGAVILGLTNMHEGAFGATTDNPTFGRTHNPWRHGTTAGGSSGGSGAAVAAGLCAGALGSDTLGSVRIPASFTGTYG